MLFKLDLKKIINILLHIFCFVLVVDPPNVIFKAKNPIFILIVLGLVVLYRKVASNKVCLFFIVYSLLLATFLRGTLAGYNFDYEYTIIFFKAFSPLLLLLWADRLELLSKLTFPCACISIISLSIVYTMFYLPDLETIIYNFMQDHDDFILMSNRYFLGHKFINVFYRTTPLVIIPCSIYYYKTLFEHTHRKRNFFLFVIFAMTLFFSGTRANMLSVFFIAVSFTIMRIRGGRIGKLISYSLLLLFSVFAFFILLVFLSEKTERSNAIKFGHLSSYADLFSNNPDILLFGQGIGSLFYSSGFRDFVPQTEWSYIEVIRYVGVLGGLFIIGIYLYPLFLIYKNRKSLKYALPFSIGYIFYLGIAGTNPLLTSSTGMLALLIAYSYVLSPHYKVKALSELGEDRKSITEKTK